MEYALFCFVIKKYKGGNMKRFIFDLITSPFSLFDNPFYDYIAMAIVGALAFVIAFNIVGELGFRGELGSITHWTIRIIVFVLLWFIFGIMIKLVTFIITNWIYILISCSLILVLFLLKWYANNNPKSILNKKLF